MNAPKHLLARTLAAAFGLLSPAIAFAACTPGQNTFCNILSFPDLQTFVVKMLQVFVTISLPIIGFFIVFVGFKFVAAQGNESKLKTAKENFMYVIIGAALILGAWVLATLIGSTISQLAS